MNELAMAWSIAGSDSSGAAGVQADAKVFAALGVQAASIVTATTAQGLGGFHAAQVLTPDVVRQQLHAVREMGEPRAIKLGMLGDAALVREVARVLAGTKAFVVCDPVLVSSSGGCLLDADGARALLTELLPRVDLLTPNVPEAEALLGRAVAGPEGVELAARELLAKGAKRVLIKGGHLTGNDESALVHDFYSDGTQSFWLHGRRHLKSVRGTGCALSSAIAAFLVKGEDLEDSLVAGRAYVSRAIRKSRALHAGLPAYLHHEPWPVSSEDMPWLTRRFEAGRAHPSFPSCGPGALGFYPIVDRTAWLERLLPLGVTTAQLRIKDLTGDELTREIKAAITLARRHGCRLFINDYWQLAIEHGAYGVHLGQEDLDTADVAAIAKAGLRLGVSTHCYFEAARAHALAPSYLALGPVFPTTCKSMRFGPRGFARVAEWRKLFDYELVAIGGLKLEHTQAVCAAGARGVAVISDVTQSADPEQRARQWIEAL